MNVKGMNAKAATSQLQVVWSIKIYKKGVFPCITEKNNNTKII
jgi:hypothetical protein